MVRGSGKYKVKRGGGRQFTDVRELALAKDKVAGGKRPGRENTESDEESEEEEEDGEEEEGEEDGEGEEDVEENERSAAGNSGGIVPSTGEDIYAAGGAGNARKEKAKAADGDLNDEDADLPGNPNRLPVKNMAISDTNAPREPNRKEREAKEKQEAKERYWKLQQQGKTDQAKADLARLAQIRKQREEAAAARKSADGAKVAEADVKQKK